MQLQYRSPITVVLLSLLTCGIYGIYFEVTTQDAIKAQYTKEVLPSGITVFLLGLITCGIYTFYWIYKTSMIINEISEYNGIRTSDDIVLMVILAIFVTPICFYAILQTKINTIVTNGTQY